METKSTPPSFDASLACAECPAFAGLAPATRRTLSTICFTAPFSPHEKAYLRASVRDAAGNMAEVELPYLHDRTITVGVANEAMQECAESDNTLRPGSLCGAGLVALATSELG